MPTPCYHVEYTDAQRCWLREGEPPYVTAGKTPSDLTCAAGAGSILTPGYHGFLQNGVLT